MSFVLHLNPLKKETQRSIIVKRANRSQSLIGMLMPCRSYHIEYLIMLNQIKFCLAFFIVINM